MIVRRTSFFLMPLVVLLLAVPAANAAATRTWVSGVGDDANPCSRTAPCKTYAGAISKTEEFGQISTLDPGGYGAVSIIKAMTITGEGTYGSILNSLTHGVIINAGADDDVVLRSLDIHGGTAGNACSGVSGVRILSARSVTLQDVVISGNQTAVSVAPTANPVEVVLDRVALRNNCTQGINVAPVAGQAANVLVRDSIVTSSGIGLRVAPGGRATVSDTSIYGNTTGLVTVDSGIIDLSFSSLVRGNDTDGTPTSTFGVGPAGPQGAQGVAGPQGVQGVQGPQGAVLERLLVVPNQVGLRVTRGRSVSVGYVATGKAITTLTVKRNGRQVARIGSVARRGGNALVWNGRIARGLAPAGTYALTLRSVGDDQQVATANVTLTIVAPRARA